MNQQYNQISHRAQVEMLPKVIQDEIDRELSMLGIVSRETKTAGKLPETLIQESIDAGTKLVRKINILCGEAFKSMTVDEFMLQLRLIDQESPKMTVKQFMEGK